jgi:hypothetical protein
MMAFRVFFCNNSVENSVNDMTGKGADREAIDTVKASDWFSL